MVENINMAYYRKEDWNRFISSADDKENLHATWEEWHASYMKAKMHLTLKGLIIQDFVVDIDELNAYCKRKGIKNDGKARSQFVSNR